MANAEKVAVLLLALERSLASQLLHRFDPDDIELIRDASERLDPITATDLATLVEEFAGRFSRAVNLIGDTGDMDQLLTNALSEIDSADQQSIIPGEKIERPVWETIIEFDEDKIITFLLGEHPQTATLILAKGGPQFAALIMGKLPSELRDGLVRRLLNLRPVGSLPVTILESGIAHTLMGDDGSEDIDKSRSQLANIINMMDNSEKNAVIETLLRDKPSEAEDIKRRLFSFEDIEDLPDKSRLTLFDQVSSDNVVKALVDTSDVLKELVLSSLSSRTRRMVEAELKGEAIGDEREIADARRSIAAIALQLAERGEIELRKPEASDN